MSLPERDSYSTSKTKYISMIAMAMAGKAAEIIKFGEDNVSSGPVSDIQQVSRIARAMVTRFGMSDAVGNIDLTALIDFHRSEGRLATVTGVRPTSRYGEMRVEGNKVAEFREKPTAEGVVSGGFFVLLGCQQNFNQLTHCKRWICHLFGEEGGRGIALRADQSIDQCRKICVAFRIAHIGIDTNQSCH